jgi:hypothetical protein
LGGVGAGDGLGKGDGCGVTGDVVPGFGAKANLTVTIDLEDLKAATADAIGDTVYGNGLSAAMIRRLACDANIIPIVLGSNSESLDVGRQERLVTRAMRRALNTRDRGCVVCGAPPIMCDAHHLTSWIDGGETKLNNLALLCRRHHVDLHNGHWTITIANGTVHVARPYWADPPPALPHRRSDSTFRAPEPPSDMPTRLAPPSEDPSRSDPQDEGPPPPDPSGERPARLARSAGSPSDSAAETALADHPLRLSTEADSPWDGTADGSALRAAGDAEIRSSRWHADHATYAAAARFAVWDVDETNDADPLSSTTI